MAYTYDANGNLTSDGISSYVWNARHQLIGISGPDTLGFGYDGLGRRRSLTVNGRTTVTLYDGWNPIQLQENGVAVENRLMGLGLDAIYARVRDGLVESYLTDALGSVLELRDAAQARTVSYTYDPYGGTHASGTSSNTVKYTGREEDLGDLYYYRHRYYKPSIGRFLSEDPIGLAGGENLYTYVENDPINFIDPEGLAKYEVGRPETHPGSKEHIHWGDKKDPRGNAVNKDGTVRHGKEPPKKVKDIINKLFKGKGWKLPGIPPIIDPCVLDPSICNPWYPFPPPDTSC